MRNLIYNVLFGSKETSANLKGLAEVLLNLPGLVFLKDIESGQYTACNQAYAEYVHKEKIEDVIGLTDYDLHDKESADSFIRHDRETLVKGVPNVFYEVIPDASGNPRQVQTTKMLFSDADGRKCIMGICIDVTGAISSIEENIQMLHDFEQVQQDRVTYSRIARALSADYENLYYVNLTTDQFIEYSSQSGQEGIAFERKEDDFFDISRMSARSQVYYKDQELFRNAFSKKNIIQMMREQGSFSLTYRKLNNGMTAYMNMKAMRMSGDDRHIIIGVNNIDAQMREQEAMKRVKEENTTYSRIAALAGNYICIYTVDLETDHYTVYSTTREYEAFGFVKEGENFYNQFRKDSQKVICPKDLSMFNRMFKREKIMEGISQSGVFSMRYRMMIDGAEKYTNLQAAMVEEKEGKRVIVGISDVDEQVRREMAYARELATANRKANIDALTRVKNKHAYLDLVDEIDKQTRDGGFVEYAVVVCDVNGLKEVNDTLGHQAGDVLLKEACAIICNTFKRSPVFRIGGDEFVIIARNVDYANIDNLLAALSESNEKNKKTGGAVIACGMSRYNGDRSIEDVLKRADEQMYINKRKMREQDGQKIIGD